MKQLLALLIAVPLIAWANPDSAAWADPDLATETAEVAPPPPPPPAPKKPAAFYTLPFHLRPISAGNVVRLDNVVAFYDATDAVSKGANTGGSLKGIKQVSILNAGYRIAKDFGVLARIGLSNNFPNKDHPNTPGTKLQNGYALTNGALLFSYTPQFVEGDIRTAFYLGATIPIGSGGGSKGNPVARNANMNNLMVRSAMDNGMFIVNDMAIMAGAALAYVKHGLTLQGELTYLEPMRVRANKPDTGFYQTDVVKRNFMAGAFVGYAIIPQLSAGVELRYQLWLKPPHNIRNQRNSENPDVKAAGDKRMSNLTGALGLRGNFKVGEKTFFRPALSYGMGLAGEIGDQKYHLIQLDLPFIL